MRDRNLTLGNVRVLVVEDDPNNRIVISRLLRLAGVGQDRFFETDGDAAAFLRETAAEVDIVFLDLQLPRKDGYKILAELREDVTTAGLLVVALTANVMKQDIERCRKAGFDGFIGKPIDGRRFSEILGKILAGESVWTIA
jgi:two-component system cell cycle response regulator DivK